MPYICAWIHFIWATKNREPLIQNDSKIELYKHIRENAREKKIHLDFINGTKDHVHLLVSLNSGLSIAKVAQLLKGESSKWVNENKILPHYFKWQEEYIAVSISKSHLEKVRNYIKNQEKHHNHISFQEEYDEFMKVHGFEIIKGG
ncbi:IS200/IS605 family transposase [bacterium]|nr:IS200/IS605 family transposase [bacterium]